MGYVIFVLPYWISSLDSTAATAANAKALPQRPWSLAGVTLLFAARRQSHMVGSATFLTGMGGLIVGQTSVRLGRRSLGLQSARKLRPTQSVRGQVASLSTSARTVFLK